jgi:hypothetical protein
MIRLLCLAAALVTLSIGSPSATNAQPGPPGTNNSDAELGVLSRPAEATQDASQSDRQGTRPSDWSDGIDKCPSSVAAGVDLPVNETSRVVLKIDQDSVRQALVQGLRDDVRVMLRELRAGYTDLAVRDGGIELRLRQNQDLARVLSTLSQATFPLSRSTEIAVSVTEANEPRIRVSPTEAAFAERLRASVQGRSTRSRHGSPVMAPSPSAKRDLISSSSCPRPT